MIEVSGGETRMTKEGLFNLALKTFLFLSPIFFFRDYELSMARGMFFVFGAFALFALSLSLKPKRACCNVWVALIMLWALLRVFTGDTVGTASAEWFNFWLSSAGFIYVLAGGLLYYTVVSHVERPEDYVWPLVAVGTVNAILIGAQLTGHDFMWTVAPATCGFFETTAQLGQYSALSLPLLAYISPWLMLIPLFTLYAAKSVSAVIALSIGIVFWSWQRKRKYATLLLIIPVILGIFNYKYIASKWKCRPVMWERTLRVALKRPYLGHGYRSFQKEVTEVESKADLGLVEYSRAHSFPLHTAQELGFPMVIFIGGFFIGLWRKFKAKAEKDAFTYLLATSVLIVLINSCGQTLLRYASLTGTFIVLLALLRIKLGEENGKHI